MSAAWKQAGCAATIATIHADTRNGSVIRALSGISSGHNFTRDVFDSGSLPLFALTEQRAFAIPNRSRVA